MKILYLNSLSKSLIDLAMKTRENYSQIGKKSEKCITFLISRAIIQKFGVDKILKWFFLKAAFICYFKM